MTELEKIELEDKLNSMKVKFNAVLSAYNDTFKNGIPDRVAVAYPWGSTVFFVGQETGNKILTVIQEEVKKQLTLMESEINSLENGQN